MLILYAVTALIGALFLLQCAVVGGAVLQGLRVNLKVRGLDGFFAICLGMLLNMATLFLLGIAGRFEGKSIAVAALALLVSSLYLLRRIAGPNTLSSTDGLFAATKHRLPLRGNTEKMFDVATLAVFFLLAVSVSMHPPGHWDDTMYQLPLARSYVEHQAIVLNEYLRFPLFPQNFNLLFGLGMLLGDALQPWLPLAGEAATAGVEGVKGSGPLWQFGASEIFAQTFATLPLFVMVLGFWAASRHYLGSGVPGLLAGLLLFAIGPVKSTLGFAYIDNGLAMFCWAAALMVAAAARTWNPFRRAAATNARDPARSTTVEHPGELSDRSTAAALFAAGLLAGAACGTKYFGMVFAFLLGFIVAATAWISSARRWAPVWRLTTVYVLGTVIAGGWWYVRSYLVSGDPAHPAGAAIFGFFLWNEGDLALQNAEQAMHGVARNPLMWPAALLEAGVLPWLPAFVGLFLRRVPPAIRVLQVAFVAYMLFWFFVTQVPRYLAPVYGLGCFLSMHAMYVARRWASRRVGWLSMRHASLVVLTVVTIYAGERSAKYVRESARAEQVLATSSGYALYQTANTFIPEYGDRLVQVGFENGVYFFNGTVIGDHFGPGRYRDILGCEQRPCAVSPERLQSVMARHDARMVLLSRGYAIDLEKMALPLNGWSLLAENEEGVLLALPHAAPKNHQ